MDFEGKEVGMREIDGAVVGVMKVLKMEVLKGKNIRFAVGLFSHEISCAVLMSLSDVIFILNRIHDYKIRWRYILEHIDMDDS